VTEDLGQNFVWQDRYQREGVIEKLFRILENAFDGLDIRNEPLAEYALRIVRRTRDKPYASERCPWITVFAMILRNEKENKGYALRRILTKHTIG
jgi:hypothetical protein